MSNIQPQCNKRKRKFHGAGTEFPNMNKKEKKFDLQERFTMLIPKPQLGNAKEG